MSEKSVYVSAHEFLKRVNNGERDFSGMKIVGESDKISHINLDEVKFSNTYLTGIIFQDCTFQKTIFENASIYCKFEQCAFSETSFMHATISCQFSCCAFFGVSFMVSSFRGGYIRECIFRKKCNFFSASFNGTWGANNSVDMLEKYDTINYTMGGATHEEVLCAAERFKKSFTFCGSGKAVFSNGNVLEAQFDGGDYIDFTGYDTDGNEIDGGQLDLAESSFLGNFESIINAVTDFMEWQWGTFSAEIDGLC